MKNINWSKIINNMDVNWPEIGDEAPDMEMYPTEMDPSEIVGSLTRITLDIFVFDSDDLEQGYMMQNEKMRIYQDISLAQSQNLVAKAKKKRLDKKD